MRDRVIQRRGERSTGWLDKPSGYPGVHNVSGAAHVRDEHGQAAGHGFDGSDAEAVRLRGEDEKIGAGVQVAQHVRVRFSAVNPNARRSSDWRFGDDVEFARAGQLRAEGIEQHWPALAREIAADEEQTDWCTWVSCSPGPRLPEVEVYARRHDVDTLRRNALAPEGVGGPRGPGRKL